MCEIYSAQPDEDKFEIQCAPNLGRIKFILYKVFSISRLLINKIMFASLTNLIDRF